MRLFTINDNGATTFIGARKQVRWELVEVRGFDPEDVERWLDDAEGPGLSDEPDFSGTFGLDGLICSVEVDVGKLMRYDR